MVTESCERVRFESSIEGFWQHLGNLLQVMGATIVRWDQLARQRRELSNMDDMMLKDIGISKADAERISNRRFWDDPIKKNENIDSRYRVGD